MFLGFASQAGQPTPSPTLAAAGSPEDSQGPADPAFDQFVDEEEDSEIAVAVMGDIAPWAVSILLHSALVMIAIMYV